MKKNILLTAIIFQFVFTTLFAVKINIKTLVTETPGSPTNVVKSAIIKVQNLVNKKTKEKLTHAEIKKAVQGMFDYSYLSQLVLKNHWAKLGKKYKEKFVDSFRVMLENNYVKKTGKYSGEYEIVFTKETIIKNRATVICMIKQKEVDIETKYHLRKKSGKWNVYDVEIDDASLVQSYQSQFDRYIKKHSYAKLLAAIKKKHTAA